MVNTILSIFCLMSRSFDNHELYKNTPQGLIWNGMSTHTLMLGGWKISWHWHHDHCQVKEVQVSKYQRKYLYIIIGTWEVLDEQEPFYPHRQCVNNGCVFKQAQQGPNSNEVWLDHSVTTTAALVECSWKGQCVQAFKSGIVLNYCPWEQRPDQVVLSNRRALVLVWLWWKGVRRQNALHIVVCVAAELQSEWPNWPLSSTKSATWIGVLVGIVWTLPMSTLP